MSLQYEEALARILRAIPAPGKELTNLCTACGRVLAEPVMSPRDLPLFDNSAMDGYAVRADDVHTAGAESPVWLRVIGKTAAGDVFGGEVTSGTCLRLFTGSALPRGADAVVMQEDTCVEPGETGRVAILEPAKPWENVRLQGEDVKRGASLGQAGEILTAGRISLLAAAGLAQVPVGRRPVVGLLSTGSELKEPGQALEIGQVYESNRHGLAALIQRTGAVAEVYPMVQDKLAATRAALDRAFNECDAVVTSGGVSVGEMDLVKRAFTELGGEVQFWRVAIKPGRPFAFGQYRGKILFGLPGNPVSAFVTCLLLVRPALLRWQGAKDVLLPTHPGVLAEPIANHGERRHFVRVKVDHEGRVHSAGVQGSHVLSSLAEANGLLDVAPQSTLPTGAAVQVMRWE